MKLYREESLTRFEFWSGARGIARYLKDNDFDTIDVDVIENCDYLVSGMAQDILNIWKNSNDKKAVEQMFYEFTDMEFEDYLLK